MKQHNSNHSAGNASFFGKSKNFTEPVYSLKVPESKKTKDWYIDYMEYIVPSDFSMSASYKESKKSYEVYNGDLSAYKEEIKKFCDPAAEDEFSSIEEEVLSYPKLHNKVNVLKGEKLKRNDNFKVILLSARAIKDKNEKLVEALKASVDESIKLEIEQLQMQMQGMNPEQINQEIEKLRTQATPEDIMTTNYSSEFEIFYNKGLKFAYYDQDIKFKEMETIEDVIIDDKCFVYSGWKYGKPHIAVRNTLQTGFHKSANNFFVHKGDHVWYREPITIGEAWNEFGNILSNDELESLGLHTYARNHKVNKNHDVLGSTAIPVFDTLDVDLHRSITNSSGEMSKNVGTHQANGNNSNLTEQTTIWKTHFEFKAFKEVKFLSYNDDMGEKITIIVLNSFKVPKSAEKIKFTNKFGDPSVKFVWQENDTEYTVEKLWIPRKYEVVRLGTDVYPIFREVPFQYTDIDRPFSTFELSTKGAVFTSRNADSISLFQRAIPLYLQYLYIKHIQNRELSKYQGYVQDIDVDQIPEELGKDVNGDVVRDPIAVSLMYRKRLGINFYSGSQKGISGIAPATRAPGSSSALISTANDIFNLQQLSELVDREMGMAMGVSPQRESNFSSGSNVADNQQAITQSHHITEPYFYMHSLIWRDALKDYLKNFRTYAEEVLLRNNKEHYLHYILPDNTEELLKITPKMLDHVSIDMFVTNSSNDERYKETMLQLSHSFGQNAGEGMEAVSALLKSISSGASTEEVHKMIQIEADKQRQRMQSGEQQNAQMQKEIKLMEDQAIDKAHKYSLEEIDRKGEWDVKKAAVTSYIGQEDKDQDNDGIPDQVEILKHLDDLDVKDRELNQEDRRIAQKDEELRIKEKDVNNKNLKKV